MKIRIATTGATCVCDYTDTTRQRQHTEEHFKDCPFADSEQVIDNTLCAERLDLVEIITDN